jgi:DNA-binding NarL/FixJ family response regulator
MMMMPMSSQVKPAAPSHPIRVLVVDDHPLVREGISLLLSKESSITVVGQAGNGEDALSECAHLSPDVVMLDVSLPDESGIDLARRIKAQRSSTRILFLSMHGEEEFVRQALQAGGDGYVVKASRSEEIVEGIHEVYQGKRYVSAAIGQAMSVAPASGGGPVLKGAAAEITDREREVLSLVARGLSAKEMARELSISHRTVETHRMNLMKKLGAKNSADLIRIGFASGLVKG